MADFAMEALTRQMDEISFKEETRESKQMSTPDVELLYEFDMLCTKIMRCERIGPDGRTRKITSFFGVPPLVQAKIWELINKHETIEGKFQKKHLLWGLHYLKEYPTTSVMCGTMQTEKRAPDEKTLRKFVSKAIDAIYLLYDKIIVWVNWFTNDKGNNCLIGVDCKDCYFQQILIPNPRKPGKLMRNKALYSSKLNGPGLRYEVGTALLSNHIVWISGPWLPGDWNDLSIFRQDLMHRLAEGERVEADDGYHAEALEFVVRPLSADNLGNEESLQSRRQAQGRIKVFNRHLANWNCVSHKFIGKGTSAEKMQKHNKMFCSVAIIKQITMEMGIGEVWKLGEDYK